MNYRLSYHTLPIPSPLECLLDITKSVSPKINSWSALLNLSTHGLPYLCWWQLRLSDCSGQYPQPLSLSLLNQFPWNLVKSIFNIYPAAEPFLTSSRYHLGLNSITFLQDYFNNLITGLHNFTLVPWPSVIKTAFTVIPLKISSDNVPSLVKPIFFPQSKYISPCNGLQGPTWSGIKNTGILAGHQIFQECKCPWTSSHLFPQPGIA